MKTKKDLMLAFVRENNFSVDELLKTAREVAFEMFSPEGVKIGWCVFEGGKLAPSPMDYGSVLGVVGEVTHKPLENSPFPHCYQLKTGEQKTLYVYWLDCLKVSWSKTEKE